MSKEPTTEREAVAQIFAQQEPIVQDYIKEVLAISRQRMHQRHHAKGLLDLYSNALKKLVKS
ncbi:hypothetical protein ACFPIJ_11935 [Dactylosporangium cerinum]|uniref:Uncharacterized protein n=1 Tax=Dactylosporangium cerinum TaxID=1434730 RepID=A0ABV9VQ90_9ACTN